MREAAVKAREIHTDDRIRFPFERQSIKLCKEAAELGVVLYDVRKADDRMFGHIERELDSGGGHARTAGPKKARLQARMEGLIIGGRRALRVLDLFLQCFYKLRRQQIPAGFTRNHHEAFGPHGKKNSALFMSNSYTPGWGS